MGKHLISTFRIGVYGVLIENGKVLLTETLVPSGVITNFPGGGLSLGESPVDAVLREFHEETDLFVEAQELLFCSHQLQQNPEYPNEQLIHIYFRVRRASGEVNLTGNGDDVVAAYWLSFDELQRRRILAPDLEFIQHHSFRSLF